MKKFLIFIIVFIASAMMGSIGGQSSIVTGDFFYMHPQNTTANGLVEIAETVISKSLVVNDKEVTCMAKNIFFAMHVTSLSSTTRLLLITVSAISTNPLVVVFCGCI